MKQKNVQRERLRAMAKIGSALILNGLPWFKKDSKIYKSIESQMEWLLQEGVLTKTKTYYCLDHEQYLSMVQQMQKQY